MNRRRMLHAFAAEVGEYEDAAVLPEETDPQLYLSRNRQPQPFHLICSKDNVLSQLSGAADVHLRDSSVNRFRMVVRRPGQLAEYVVLGADQVERLRLPVPGQVDLRVGLLRQDGGVLVLPYVGREGVQHPAAVHDAASVRVW